MRQDDQRKGADRSAPESIGAFLAVAAFVVTRRRTCSGALLAGLGTLSGILRP